ncbi:MAG: extensin family protein [Thalassovita sp.]
MKRGALILCAFWAVIDASAGFANAPGSSLRPVARGQVAPSVIRPVSPDTVGVRPDVPKTDTGIVRRSLRPQARAERVKPRATQSLANPKPGSVCGDPAIMGAVVGDVPGKIKGCGIARAVRVTSVSGVRLSRGALIDCPTAKALKTWVDRGMKPAIGRRGGGVQEMRLFASYSCRTRNSKKGARISEHGKGRAVDIGAFILKDGSEMTVLKDWGNGRKGRILKEMHETACGPFGTVLGPKSDRYHKDHFHFDTARYRNGTYCR